MVGRRAQDSFIDFLFHHLLLSCRLSGINIQCPGWLGDDYKRNEAVTRIWWTQLMFNDFQHHSLSSNSLIHQGFIFLMKWIKEEKERKSQWLTFPFHFFWHFFLLPDSPTLVYFISLDELEVRVIRKKMRSKSWNERKVPVKSLSLSSYVWFLLPGH